MKQNVQDRVMVSLRGALLLVSLAIALVTNLISAGVVTAASCGTGNYCTFLPTVSGGRPAPDLVITGVEISQAIQDTNNSVPLVAGRSAILRVYAISTNATEPISNIKVAVMASSADNLSLSETPLTLSSTIPLTSSRADYSSTINFALPSSWLSGTVDVTIRLDPDNATVESNEANNVLTKRLVFNNVPPLQIKIVPIQYTHTPNQRTYPAPTVDRVSDWIMRTYPVSQVQISWHTPVSFTGNLTTSDDFSRLLNDITTLKTSEGAPKAQVYYGLIPTSSSGSSWFSSGYAGMGWIGSRAAIGLDYSSQTSQIAAHEVGHNLGMLHTPCGVSSYDQSYPYANASIGQYGLDVSSGRLYAPNANRDMMSYCDPKWISDYTYKYLYNSQIRSGSTGGSAAGLEITPSASLAQKGMVVRAQINADGASFLPAYTLSGAVNELPEAGDYVVQLLGSQDEWLAEYPVQAYAASEQEDPQVRTLQALLPLPEQPVSKIRLLKDGQVLAEKSFNLMSLSRATPGVSTERNAETVALHWSSTQQPALVRFSTDHGQTWTTLAVDQAGGEINVDASFIPEDALIEVVEASR
jgi:hypothetical protein